MFLWRISEHVDLGGIGGTIALGRWHGKPRPVVYTTETPPGALLETLVHLDAEDAPDSLNLMKINAPDDLAMDTAPHNVLQLHSTRAFGDAWLEKGATALLRVPSIIMPETWNIVLNPAHPEARRITVVESGRFRVDPRLF